MSITSVSTYGSLQTLIQNMNQVQNDLNTDQVEISSGKTSQTFDGLNGSVEQFTALSSQVVSLQNYQQSNTLTLSQQQTSNTVLGQMQQIATSVKSLMLSQISGSASTASFQQQLQSDLASLTSELNTTFQGSYIFSGTKTNTPPVTTPVPQSQVSGVPDTSYYQGSAQNITFRIADGQTITNNVRADDPAFQQIIAGINQALQATGSNTTADLQNAENLVSNGINGVISLQATVNANILNIQQVDTQSQTLQTYYQSLTSTISQSDVVGLSTKVAQDQTTLQASYEVYSTISQLSLVKYLNG